MAGPLLRVSHAVLPDHGEDSFAIQRGEQNAFFCVADGCGGLGGMRYPSLENRSGAALASELASRAFERFARGAGALPGTPEEGKSYCADLGAGVSSALRSFAVEKGLMEAGRIRGTLRRCLPTTLCGAATGEKGEVCFLWAGDSRGYVLDANGLHQCTQDDLRASPDAFDSLYCDAPLVNFFSAEGEARVHLRRLRTGGPSAVIVATDGAFDALPTPMEFELLLLTALREAGSWKSWERGLAREIRKWAWDDATLLLLPSEADFEAFQACLMPRREALQKQFVTPVRRHREDLAYARQKWLCYRETYDWTEEAGSGTMDWRI